MFDDDDWFLLVLLPDLETKQELRVFLFLLGLALVGLCVYFVFWT